jgi:hypothetical protein
LEALLGETPYWMAETKAVQAEPAALSDTTDHA